MAVSSMNSFARDLWGKQIPKLISGISDAEEARLFEADLLAYAKQAARRARWLEKQLISEDK